MTNLVVTKCPTTEVEPSTDRGQDDSTPSTLGQSILDGDAQVSRSNLTITVKVAKPERSDNGTHLCVDRAFDLLFFTAGRLPLRENRGPHRERKNLDSARMNPERCHRGR